MCGATKPSKSLEEKRAELKARLVVARAALSPLEQFVSVVQIERIVERTLPYHDTLQPEDVAHAIINLLDQPEFSYNEPRFLDEQHEDVPKETAPVLRALDVIVQAQNHGVPLSSIIGSAFEWDKTPEGWTYWSDVQDKARAFEESERAKLN